jgi:IclR family pca regulon transcriptional regulator
MGVGMGHGSVWNGNPHATQGISSATDPRTSHSLKLVVTILRCIARRQTLGVFEIADIVARSRATAHRYAITLVALGHLEQDPKRKCRLSARAADPGMAALGVLRRELSAKDALEELRDEVGYTVSMGVLDWTCVIYLYRLFGHRPGQYEIDQNLEAGARVPVYCTALGKVLLASLPAAERHQLLKGLDLVPHGPKSITTMSELAEELDSLSERDAVVSDEEFVYGARSIAVLVRSPNGTRSIAIEVTVPSQARSVNRLAREIGPPLKRTASLIAARDEYAGRR